MVVLVVAMVVAAGVWLMTLAAARGSLGANGVAGIRTTATQRSEEAWRAGHRAALPLLGWSALVVLLAGVVVLVGGLAGALTAGRVETAGIVLLVAEGVCVVVAGVVAHRAATKVPAP